MSDETNKLIDSEIRKLIDNAHVRANEVLRTEVDQLHLLAGALLEYETLTGEDIRELLDTGKLDRPDAPTGPLRPAAISGSTVPRAGKRFAANVAVSPSALGV